MDAAQHSGGSPRRRAVETRAVAWLAARRALIDPANADPGGGLLARKALVETAFLLGLRARLDPEPLSGDYVALLTQIRGITARPSYRELVARDEAALLLYAGTYAALRLCDRDDPLFRRMIERAVAGGYATVFERTPSRLLDLIHTLELCRIEHTLPTVEKVLPFTLLCSRPNVVKLADRDIHAVAQAVFYATDFALREPRWPDGFDAGEAVELLEALLVLARGRRNADLVGELLCSLLCLGIRDSAEADRAWEFLVSAQDHGGRVKGPSGLVHPRLAGGDGHYRNWATGYHTTIVAALAALLERSPRALRRPRPVTPRIRVDVEQPIRRGVVWLSDASMWCSPGTGLPAAAAAAAGAAAVGDPSLARPVLHHFAEVLADAGADLWQEQGLEVVGEFALGLRALAIRCPSLEEFLVSTAAMVNCPGRVPPQAARNAHRLAALGLIQPGGAADPTVEATRSRRPDPARVAARLPEARLRCDLGRVAGVVRDLVRAGWEEHRVTQDAVAFVLSQQSPDGAFGRPACDDPASRERVQLSWTQSVVTALAAVHRDSRSRRTGDSATAVPPGGSRCP